MPVIIDDFTIDAGATFVRTFFYLDEEGEVVNLTGYDALAQVRRSPFTEVVLSSEPTIDPVTYEITMSWTATETSRLRDSNYLYGIQLYNQTTDDVVMFTRGVVTVNQQIVR
jgi:hypothetical protein